MGNIGGVITQKHMTIAAMRPFLAEVVERRFGAALTLGKGIFEGDLSFRVKYEGEADVELFYLSLRTKRNICGKHPRPHAIWAIYMHLVVLAEIEKHFGGHRWDESDKERWHSRQKELKSFKAFLKSDKMWAKQHKIEVEYGYHQYPIGVKEALKIK